MIKIDVLYNDLDNLALSYFEFLNPKNKDGEYSAYSLIKRLEKEKQSAIDSGSKQLEEFWDYFLTSNYANLKRVIYGRPPLLESVINEINIRFGAIQFARRNGLGVMASTYLGQYVSNIFDYATLYRSKKFCHDTYAKIGIASCPYCNENTAKVDLLVEGDEVSNLMGHQLDHFFSQLDFPYLSLSFFNLIPSCYTCNSIYKRIKKFTLSTHVNPYDKSINEEFQFFVSEALMNNKNDITILYKQKATFAKTALDDFNILGRYCHDSVHENIFEGYHEVKYHSKAVVSSIEDQFGIVMQAENRYSLKEKMRIFQAPTEEKGILTRQYGKLMRDIFFYLALDQEN